MYKDLDDTSTKSFCTIWFIGWTICIVISIDCCECSICMPTNGKTISKGWPNIIVSRNCKSIACLLRINMERRIVRNVFLLIPVLDCDLQWSKSSWLKISFLMLIHELSVEIRIKISNQRMYPKDPICLSWCVIQSFETDPVIWFNVTETIFIIIPSSIKKVKRVCCLSSLVSFANLHGQL